MKRLTTYADNSYMPLWQEDLKFIQDNLIEVLTQLGKIFAYGNSTFIITGCVVTNNGTEYSITEGLIMYQGELLYCPAQQANMQEGNLPFLERQALTDADGDKLMILANQSTETYHTWDVNYAKLVVTDPEAAGTRLALTNALSLPERIEAAMLNDSGWMDMTLESGYVEVTNISRRKYGKLVSLRGSFGISSEPGEKACGVPASWAPLQDMEIVTPDYELTIKKTTGYIICTIITPGTTVILDNIHWIV